MTGYEGPTAYYPSKRDLWIEIVIWLASLGILAAAWRVALEPGPRLIRLGYPLLLGAVAAWTLWLLYSTGYTFTAQELVAQAGPLRWRVPLAAIEEVVPTWNPLSAPACSLDRLNVRHSGRRLGLLVSPADREGFLRDLRLRCPHLGQHGDSLVA